MSRARSTSKQPSKNDLRYRRIVGARLGLLYGVTLLALAFRLSREGRPTELAVQLFTSPFGLLVPEVVFTGMILLWTLVGMGVASSGRAAIRYAVVGALLVHYLVATYAIRTALSVEGGGLAAALKTAPLMVVTSVAIYAIGQVTFWVLLWRTAKSLPAARA